MLGAYERIYIDAIFHYTRAPIKHKRENGRKKHKKERLCMAVFICKKIRIYIFHHILAPIDAINFHYTLVGQISSLSES